MVTATSMLVAPRSATRTCPASARKVSWRGGRPPVLGPTSPSSTSPRSTSSPIRRATMARPRPVRATSSERRRRPPEADLVEDDDQRVERFVRDRREPRLGRHVAIRRTVGVARTARRQVLRHRRDDTLARPTFALDMGKYDGPRDEVCAPSQTGGVAPAHASNRPSLPDRLDCLDVRTASIRW